MATRLDPFIEYCVELLGGPRWIRVRRMFGGHGLYYDELFIAIVLREQLYLKADEQSARRFEEAGGSRLQVHTSTERPIDINYWSLPPDAMESPALVEPWRQLAVAAALAKPRKKPPSAGTGKPAEKTAQGSRSKKR